MKIIVAFMYMMSMALPVQAQGTAPGSSTTFVKQPDPPQYETCQMIEQSNGESGGTYRIEDPACVQRNYIKRRDYNAALEAYQRSLRIVSTDASTTQRPQEPAYENCNTDTSGSWENRDYACESRNAQKRHDYNIQLQAWNRLQTEQQSAQQQRTADEQRMIEEAARQQSATQTLQTASDLNARSQRRSQTGAQITMIASGVFAGMFAASCAGVATCNYGFLAASIAMSILSAQSSRQAHQNAMQGYAACTTQQQLSGTQANCAAVEPYNPTTGPTTGDVTNNFNPDGTCRTTQTVCDQVIASLPPGTNIRDAYKGASTFANGNGPFTVNPDGSVTIKKTGKTIKASDLNNPQAWAAAGFDPNAAKTGMATAAKAAAATGGLAGVNDDLKGKGSEKGYSGLSGFDMSSSGSSGSLDGSANGSGKGSNGSGSLSGTTVGGDGLGNGANGRKPAGQGLTRDFNGETIGAAGDDIFSMMNRRYQMKTAQDTFINN